MKLYRIIANHLAAIENCRKMGDKTWEESHTNALRKLITDKFPHGSGFDVGVDLAEESTPERLVFVSSFHRMDEHGFYDGWVDFEVVVTPSLVHDFRVRVKGKFGKEQDLKEYIGDVFADVLSREI